MGAQEFHCLLWIRKARRIGRVAGLPLMLVDDRLGELFQAPLVGGLVASLCLRFTQHGAHPGARLVEQLAQDQTVVFSV